MMPGEESIAPLLHLGAVAVTVAITYVGLDQAGAGRRAFYVEIDAARDNTQHWFQKVAWNPAEQFREAVKQWVKRVDIKLDARTNFAIAMDSNYIISGYRINAGKIIREEVSKAHEHMGVGVDRGYWHALRRYFYVIVWNFFRLRLDRMVGGTVALLALLTYLLFIFSVTPFFECSLFLGFDLAALLSPSFQLAGVLWYSFVILVVWSMASVSSLASELPRKCKNWNAEIEKWYDAKVEQLGAGKELGPLKDGNGTS